VSDPSKTYQELIDENAVLRRRIRELERSEVERRRTEEALKASEERYRQLVREAPAAIYEIDFTERKFLSVNDVMCLYLGYTREELLAMDPVAIITPETLNVFLERRMRLMAGEAITNTSELQIRHKDGSLIWVLININSSYARTVDGHVVVTVVAHDITDRKKAGEALKASEEKYRDLVKYAPAGIYEIDFTERKILSCNDAMCEYSGYTREEILASDPTQILTEESLKRFLERHVRILAGEPVPESVEFEMRRKDGGLIWCLLNNSYSRTPEGHVVSTVIIHDITARKRADEERKALQERLQRAEKMEALGTMAGGVAHALNNVLGIIVGFAQMLLHDLDKASPLREGLTYIMQSGERASAIVQDLLTLARRGVDVREVLNMNRIIVAGLESPEFKKMAAYHPAVRIKTDLEPDLLNMSGSPIHLAATVFNLAANACESMPKGGLLTIATANRYLDRPVQGYDEVREGDYVLLSVSDTGQGIAAADLPHIFEPFYTKKMMGRSGTGLGLAVVWGTVKDSRGYINVESAPGDGTTFTLYFPVTREEVAAAKAPVDVSAYMGRGETILVVDDIRGQRALAAAMLRKLNYTVATVKSGERAVDFLRERACDLVVLDMIMDPGMDGLDTYRSILAVRPGQRAIIVSGFSETERVRAAQALGAGGYVKKPYIMERLGLAVRKELDRV